MSVDKKDLLKSIYCFFIKFYNQAIKSSLVFEFKPTFQKQLMSFKRYSLQAKYV